MKYVMIIKYNLHYDEVRGHVLRSPSGTKQQLRSKSKSKRFLWKQRTHKRTKSYRPMESHNTIYLLQTGLYQTRCYIIRKYDLIITQKDTNY